MLLSVVIITRNEGHIIGNTLQSLQGLTDDIVIVDSGSTDNTVEICRSFQARVIETGWDGYGANKNKGIATAKHDWILSLDADEAVDETLKKSLSDPALLADDAVGNIKFKNFFCNKYIRFGEWSGDKHIRLFNRMRVKWNDAAVHESLDIPQGMRIQMLKGNILHYTSNSLEDYMNKTISYARLNALKYHQLGRRSGFFKLRLAPAFTFLKYYVFKLGFLDGWEGYLIARTTAWYTFLKYGFLREMNARAERINQSLP